MKSYKILILLLLNLFNGGTYAQVISEYWDRAQTKTKSEQQMKDGMQHGKYIA